MGPTYGGGILGGIQVSLGTPTTSLEQLQGFSVDVAGGAGNGPAAGGDIAIGPGGVQATITVGGGFGTFLAGSATFQGAGVTPICP